MSFDDKNEIDNFIKLLSKLPGLGPRSGRRAALAIIKQKERLLLPLKEAFNDISEKINVAKNFPDIVKKIKETMDNEHDESEIFKFEFEKN